MKQHEGNVSFLQQDLTESGSAAKVITNAVGTWGSLDILVNNAGVQIRNNILDYKNVSFLQQDLTESGSAAKVITNAVGTWGSLDIL
ncbi:SDR family NAD(P)-dependent oxidoreductase, partial [Staphylococcus saprophyticus]